MAEVISIVLFAASEPAPACKITSGLEPFVNSIPLNTVELAITSMFSSLSLISFINVCFWSAE